MYVCHTIDKMTFLCDYLKGINTNNKLIQFSKRILIMYNNKCLKFEKNYIYFTNLHKIFFFCNYRIQII